MSSGMLSLKWNNHRSTFFHVLSSIRSKESYCDATLACDGRFYPVHKLVLSTCSEYFEQIFEKTQCKHPVIVLKDIKFDDLEALMNYMYVGEVNVLQEKLSGLIKAAECLKIKGLAVPDEDPFASKENRRNQHRAEFESPRAKRRRKESFSNEDRGKNLSHRSQPRERQTNEILENVNLSTPKSTETNLSQILGGNTLSKADKSSEEIVHDNSEEDEQSSSKQFNSDGLIKKVSSHKRKGEISLIEANVKAEPPDIDIPDEDNLDSKENLHTDLGYDPNAGDLESLVDDESGSAHGGNDSEFSENILESAPQSVEDVVAQALPSSSNFQGNSFSLWEGDNSLQSFPGEGFSGDNSQGRQMVDSLQGDGSWISTGENSDQKILKIVAVNSLQSDSKKKWIMSADTLTNLIQYKCSLPTCPKTFSCPSAVKIHERVHTRERPFRCNICPFRANQKGNLVAHMRIHTLNNPYTCDYCHAKFRSSSNLTRHISTLHNT